MVTHVDDAVAAVLDLHRRLSEGVGLREVGESAVRQVARLMRGTAALWVLQRDAAVEAVAMAHPDPAAEAALHELTGGRVTGPHQLVRSLMDAGTQARIEGTQVAAVAGLMEPAYRAWFAERPVRELVVQPLRMAGRSTGLLGVARDADQPPLDAAELALLTQIAQIVSVALQTQLLQEVQDDLLHEARRNERRLDVLAHTDDLTGLPNRRGFLRALQSLDRLLPSPVGVALLDLDDFKDVNDGFGHAAGDDLLRSYAAAMSAVLPTDALVARMGGDEFAVLLHGETAAGVEQQLQAALDACPATLRVVDVDVPVRVSAGLTVREPGGSRATSDLLREADVAMYRAKRSGARLARFDLAADTGALSRLHEAALLRTALAQRELVVHYQRIVARSPDPHGAERLEALVRWPTADGVRRPDAFLPLAGDIGVMGDLTDLVLDLVVEQLAAWRHAGRTVSVAVNVPAQSLAQPGFADAVLARLHAAGLPPSAVTLEVTEDELVDADVREAVARCRELQLDVAIDDFGKGYSALGYLLDVPATELKVDRSLVARLHEQPARRVLVAHCVSLAHALGVRVVAEGVETSDELDVLHELGADWLQGYHLHRPCAAEDLPPLLP